MRAEQSIGAIAWSGSASVNEDGESAPARKVLSDAEWFSVSDARQLLNAMTHKVRTTPVKPLTRF